MNGHITRTAILGTLATIFAVVALVAASRNNYLTAAVLAVVAAAFPVSIVARRSRLSRVVSPVALQPALLTMAAIGFGVCEVWGLGVKQDIGRGIGVFIGAGFLAYGTFLIARAFRSGD